MTRRTIWRLACALGMCVGPLQAGTAQVGRDIRIVRFTADWCSTCRVLDPRIEEAVVLAGENGILVSDVDLSSGETRDQYWDKAMAWKIVSIWSAYKDRTGFAVVTDVETGAPLLCLGLPLSSSDMASKLRLARQLSAAADLPESPFLDDCPDPGPLSSHSRP